MNYRTKTKNRTFDWLMFVVLMLWAGAVLNSAFAFDLITNREAGLKKKPFTTDSTIFGRGPSIEVYGPKSDDYTVSPFGLEIRFTAHGGAKIDPDSINIRYWSDPRLSLTSRLKPLLMENRISISEARAPQGQHEIEISITDTNGFRSTLVYEFRVDK